MGTSEVDIPYAHAPPRLFILPCLAQNIDFPQSAVCADLIHRLFIFSLLALHFRANTTCSGTFFFFLMEMLHLIQFHGRIISLAP